MKASDLKVGSKFGKVTLKHPQVTLVFNDVEIMEIDVDGGSHGKLFRFHFNFAVEGERVILTMDSSLSAEAVVKRLQEVLDGEYDVEIAKEYRETSNTIQVFESEEDGVGPCIVVPQRAWSLVEECLLKDVSPMDWYGLYSDLELYKVN